jgi:SAM-dependent methyltransferase
MATTCPVGFDVPALRARVREVYGAVAVDPRGEFHFHRGARYAVEYLGYDPEELATVPELALSRFAGVGNPHRIGVIELGETVLDHACGGGTDLLIAARKVGPRGRALGFDMTPEMCDVARRAAEQSGLGGRVEVREALFEALPVPDGSVDVVISNGVLNLAPDKDAVLREIHRVLAPGGRLFLSDVAVERELKLDARGDPELWAACIGGALTETELGGAARRAGFEACRLLDRFDCYANTPAREKASLDLEPHGVNFFARKPS